METDGDWEEVMEVLLTEEGEEQEQKRRLVGPVVKFCKVHLHLHQRPAGILLPTGNGKEKKEKIPDF